MVENYNQQKGFVLIIILIAVLIIAAIAFGFINRKGQIEQNREIKNKAAEDLKAINEKLEKNNQQIKNDLNNKE